MLEGIHFAPGDRNFNDNGIAGKQVVHGQEHRWWDKRGLAHSTQEYTPAARGCKLEEGRGARGELTAHCSL